MKGDVPEVEEISTRYEPKQFEQKWYEFWEQKGYFRPESDRDPKTTKKAYCITIPPPNITGSLHIGHALCYTIQDVLTRWKRMQGFNTLCLPGADHAGIATQMVVEKALRAEGTSRRELGREKFIERVWQWKEQYGGTIIAQFRRMGFSFDWSRLRFTMDPDYAHGVTKMFVDWWENGHLYLGTRVGNWCPTCHTVISDIEVEDKETNGKLYYIRYPFAMGEGHIVVATTRPETMLGDVAVAVNPADERYIRYHGQELVLPLVGRPIPIIADEHPDPAFGTGAVKVTPAHDLNDYEIGQRHGLEMPVILDEDARVVTTDLINEYDENLYLTKYNGMDRYEARKAVLADLEELGLLEKVEDHKLVMGACARCHTVLEPLLMEQWYAYMKQLAEPAAEVVRKNEIQFSPSRFEDIYLRWMENIRDWPVSRQLWWGHQIPAWYCRACHPEDFEQEDGEWRVLKRRSPIVAIEPPTKCPHCASKDLVRDPWVLDTWFSSALWPHATLGWPKETDDLQRFYPTGVLVTAKDIIYLWVARMIMTGLYYRKQIPFKDVYIYATVLNEQGQRMSKSLGTGIDPLEVIDKYGADALRYSLLLQTGTNQEIRFGEKRIEEGRNFCNKIWNASRFVLMNIEPPLTAPSAQGDLIDTWILSRLSDTISAVTKGLEDYNMADATKPLFEFFWGELCDWYIEAAKPRLADPARRGAVQSVLLHVMDSYLRLLHPFMPHISEEIYQRLPGHGESLCIADWPTPTPRDPEAEKAMETLMEIVRGVRNLRAEVGISAMQTLPLVYIVAQSEEATAAIAQEDGLIAGQAWFERVEFAMPGHDVKRVEISAGGADIYLPIEGVIDMGAERSRLDRERQKLEAELEAVKGRLGNPMFVDRAKPEAVAKARQDLESLASALAKVMDRQQLFANTD